jgi:DNA-binding transcriptional MerR regulator
MLAMDGTGPNEERGSIRIGELARRTGTSPDLLRAWERRYGLLEPQRSEGGFRLYSPRDERRIRAMKALMANGLSAAEAADQARRGPDAGTTHDQASPGALALDLEQALERWDEAGAQEAIDRLLATFSVETVLGDAILPVLRALGEGWERGLVPVAREHFATNIIRGRLMSLAGGWGRGTGPVAVLACPPGELHDLGLLCFGIALRRMGWRIAYLGPDTPLAEVLRAAERTEPAAIVLASIRVDGFAGMSEELATLADRYPLYLGGGPPSSASTVPSRAVVLSRGPVEAASEVSASLER